MKHIISRETTDEEIQTAWDAFRLMAVGTPYEIWKIKFQRACYVLGIHLEEKSG